METISDLSQRGGHLREFLRKYGDETNSGRRAFVPLVETRLALEEAEASGRFDQLLRVLSSLGPEPGSVPTLKERAFGRKDDPVAEARTLAFLATANLTALDAERLAIPSRARMLSEQHPDAGLTLLRTLVHSPLTLVGESEFTAAAQALKDTELRLDEADYDVAVALIGLHPSLAAGPWAWSSDLSRQRQVLEVLRHSPPVPPALARVLAARMIAIDSPLAEEAIRVLREPVVQEVLDRLNSTPPGPVGGSWSQAIRKEVDAMRHWLEGAESISPEAAVPIIRTFAPDDPLVSRHQKDWMRLLAANQTGTAGDDFVLAFLFVAAARFTPIVGIEVTKRTFPPLYRMAAANRLSEDTWTLLRKHLPHLPFWLEWDMCEKLRRGLANRFMENSWPPLELEASMPDRDTKERVLAYMNQSRGGRRFVDELLGHS